MKKFVRILGIAAAAIAGLPVLDYAVAWGVAKSRYNRVYAAHDAGFPIPFPLSPADLAKIRADRVAAGASPDDPPGGVDLAALARVRAEENGKHLIDTRVGCAGCHGADFSGCVIVDAPLVGRWVAPNISGGVASVTRDFTAADWDHAVRHGLRRGGLASSMPAVDFFNLSDHELSDIVAYIRSRPTVDRNPGSIRLGRLFSLLIATDADAFTAARIDHLKPHAVEPPAAVVSVEYGEHLVQVCRGCHGERLSGGKLKGDPNMPVVANLTPHEMGLKDWTVGDFLRALREGKRKDGTAIDPAMPWKAYGQMGDAELKAMYAYLRTVPPLPKGNR
ncbi:MAG TPA: cytochrome c [Steroidobacteraceae bacterium]|jgi:mono/diheme cytochrome c family protein|nr:cytochrome c [Steroidobacteraceae bacterium]